MSDAELPEWLGVARTGARAQRALEARDDWPRIPRIGDLRIAEPTVPGRSDPRMVLVIGLEPEIGVAEVALVSNETEFTSHADVVVPAGASGLPFDLLVETWAVAHLWCIQLGRLVAELGPKVAWTVRENVTGHWTTISGPQCVRAEDAPLDQLSLFRERELCELGALSEDCREAGVRHGSRSETVVDPVVVDSATGGSGSRGIERWLAAAEILTRSPAAAVPVAALEASLETSGFWSRLRGPDEVQALLPLVERALADRPPECEEHLEFEPGRTRPAESVDREFMSMLSAASKRGTRTVRLLTLPEAWTGEFCDSMVMARAVTAEGTEVQIIRHNLEAGS